MFNSLLAEYKTPFGAVAAGEEMSLRFALPAGDGRTPELLLYRAGQALPLLRLPLSPAPDGRAILVIEGATLPGGDVGPVAAGINFLNENGGVVRQEPAVANQPPRLVIEMAGQAPTSAGAPASLS